MNGKDTTGIGAIFEAAMEGVRLQGQINAQNSLIAVAQKAIHSANSWKQRAEELEKTVKQQDAQVQMWGNYASKKSERVKSLEADLKKQSAEKEGQSAVRAALLADLERLTTPEQCPNLDQSARQKIFDEAYARFMSDDKLT